MLHCSYYVHVCVECVECEECGECVECEECGECGWQNLYSGVRGGKGAWHDNSCRVIRHCASCTLSVVR